MYAAEGVLEATPADAQARQPDAAQLLLERARRGDLDAVRTMLAQHREGLFGIAWGYLGNRDEALDACQEALRKALANVERYDPHQPLSAWLTRILRNCCLDRLRRLKLRRHASLEQRREVGAPEPRSFRPDPESRLLQGELHDQLRHAIGQLRDEEREVIILRDVLDWPYARIEAFLDIGHGTLASMIHRARARLRGQLEDYLLPPGEEKRP